jgi:hypothetical protein
MSVNSKMAAIADKIRALLGITGTMGLDAMATNLSTLQNQITNALTTLEDMGVDIPSGAKAGNLAELIATLPPIATYTNLLKLAVDASGNPYNNGTGYKLAYFSGENEVVPTSTTWYVTGYLPVSQDASGNIVIRFKNIEVMEIPAASSSTKMLVKMYKSDKSLITTSGWWTPSSLPPSGWSPVYDDSGNIKQLSIHSSYKANTKFVRFCFAEVGAKPVITCNEPID